MIKNISVFEGDSLTNEVPQELTKPDTQAMVLKGLDSKPIIFSKQVLSKHIMIVGGIGSGKTNTFYHMIAEIERLMSSNDITIIFDTKGDFLKHFKKPDDIVISNNEEDYLPQKNYWNIFSELSHTDNLIENIYEISTMIFAKQIKNTSQVFFPQAARDLLSAIIYHYYIKRELIKSSNQKLISFLNSEDFISDLIEILDEYSYFRGYKAYLGDISKGLNDQALGIISELQQGVREFFIDKFAKEGNLSIRELIKENKKRKIFIEYDISLGSTMSPILSLLLDLALKEALGRKKPKGDVYLLIDEFKLLPNLKHIEDAVNFGRSLGIKTIIGIQNVDQIYAIYGHEMGLNIFSGFVTKIFFRANDYSTRKYIIDYAGRNRKNTTYKFNLTNIDTINEANVIEDWDIQRLRTGEAIICSEGIQPFKFKFNLYKER